MCRFGLMMVVCLCVHAFGFAGDSGENGKRFDTGLTMTKKAEKAPEALDKAAFLLGQYDVTWTFHEAEGKTRTAKAQARIDYMNRGWLYGETFNCDNFDGKGTALETLGFLTYSPSTKAWGLGVGNSYTERVHMANGDFNGDKLVLLDVRRPNGVLALAFERQTFSKTDSGFTWLLETSKDGQTWQKSQSRTYKKREKEAGFLAGKDYGKASEGRAKAGAGFDFLIGEWEASHDMTFPNGQQAKWKANATAVHVLGGKGVLEYSWFDTDPNLPDAATSILRIYNRAERRWESLYTTNRSNGLLRFGGVQEGERIILNAFDTDRTGRVSHWVFHSIKKDSYSWYGENSSDGGQTYKKVWLIDFKRKTPAKSES